MNRATLRCSVKDPVPGAEASGKQPAYGDVLRAAYFGCDLRWMPEWVGSRHGMLLYTAGLVRKWHDPKAHRTGKMMTAGRWGLLVVAVVVLVVSVVLAVQGSNGLSFTATAMGILIFATLRAGHSRPKGCCSVSA